MSLEMNTLNLTYLNTLSNVAHLNRNITRTNKLTIKINNQLDNLLKQLNISYDEVGNYKTTLDSILDYIDQN